MRRVSIVAVALIVAAGHALAADLPVRPAAPAYYPVATVYDWGGGYIGINGGYAFGQSEWTDDGPNPSGLSSSTAAWSEAQSVLVGSLAHGWSASKAILIGKISAAQAPVLFAPASLFRPPPPV